MKPPSKRMPAPPVHKMRPWGWLVVTALLTGLGYCMYRQPYLLLFIIGAAIFGYLATIYNIRYRRVLAASRKEDNICDFVRSFDRGTTDTWILRAVYEELGRHLSVDGRAIPIRPSDECEKDLKIDPEDLDDLGVDIAYRAQRSMDGAERNPLYGKVHTVADIVTFLEYQPRTHTEEFQTLGEDPAV
jgi:hypothetical protein